MNAQEMFLFDLGGFLIVPGLLTADEVAAFNAIIDRDRAANPRKGVSFDFMRLDASFRALIDDRRILPYMRTMCGEHVRLDHTYGLEMTRGEGHSNLHGGPYRDNGSHYYAWHQGRMWNGLVVISIALAPQRPGDGGFIVVPGSHKSNLPLQMDHDGDRVLQPALEPGDAILFTEALVHGTRQWQADHTRRSLLLKYNAGHMTWGRPESLDWLRAESASPTRSALLEPPYVGGRKPVPRDDG
ncbi:hypothetical protein FJZ36_02245 [Candidatus Poribacteria bacterium]|nr:hypothetical protein [Candidatus Poribacteria bacterium]